MSVSIGIDRKASLVTAARLGITLEKASNKYAQTDCCICLKGMKKTDRVHELACKHIMHETCANETIRTVREARGEPLCPTCRQEIHFDERTIAIVQREESARRQEGVLGWSYQGDPFEIEGLSQQDVEKLGDDWERMLGSPNTRRAWEERDRQTTCQIVCRAALKVLACVGIGIVGGLVAFEISRSR